MRRLLAAPNGGECIATGGMTSRRLPIRDAIALLLHVCAVAGPVEVVRGVPDASAPTRCGKNHGPREWVRSVPSERPFERLFEMQERPSSSGARLRAAAGRLLVDLTTAKVVSALKAVGIPCIVLKGPSVVHWVYDEEDHRQYLDSDLMVGPSDMNAAQHVLTGLGFRKVLDEADTPDKRRVHAHAWTRTGDPVPVDLHRTLHGTGVSPDEVWTVLNEHTTTLPIAGVDAKILDRPATILHVALHATQHGRGQPQVQRDLARALDRFDLETWRAAALLAERLNATPAFATGLRLHPHGVPLAVELHLPEDRPFEVALSALTPPPGAQSLYALATTRGSRRKIAVLTRRLVPPVAYMRYTSALARRGPLGVAAAYLCRPFVLAYRFGPAVRTLWRASRETR